MTTRPPVPDTPYTPPWLVPLDPDEDDPTPATLARMVYGPQPITDATRAIIAEWTTS